MIINYSLISAKVMLLQSLCLKALNYSIIQNSFNLNIYKSSTQLNSVQVWLKGLTFLFNLDWSLQLYTAFCLFLHNNTDFF